MPPYAAAVNRWLSTLGSAATSWMVLIIVVLSSSLVLARGLNSEYITLWDEAVHLNVVQNLITHCCTPRLHVRDLGTDYRDWTDNDVWLHKPPIPFFINAALAAPWPRSPLALRMPALLFAEALVVVVFLLGLRFFDRSSAALAAAAFAFNRYTFDLVQGRQFSGMPDLTLAFCLLGALYCLLAITESERQRHFVAFGVCSGAAFLCKDGLAFIPFIVLGAVVAKLGWRRHARGFVCAGVVAVLIAGTSAACLAWLFPVETRYEQQRRLAHLFENVEGWSRPADYYFTAYFTRVTSPLIAGLGYLCVGWGLLQWRRKPATAVLAMWVATYLVVLTPAVSKISDFIYPIAPVLYVLIAVALVQQWRSRGYDRIVAASTAVLAAALIIHFGLLGSHQWMVRAPSWRSRIAPPAIGVTIFGLSIAILRLSRIRITRGLAALSTGAAVLVALGTSVRANLAGPDLRPRDYDRQMALRQATLALPPDLRLRDDVVLVKWSGVKKSHLYVRFWAGLESLEITAANPLDRQMAVVRRVPDVYLLADAPDPQHEPALRVGPGYLYKIR